MVKEIQLQRSQWFYDDAGYYSYVLLNVEEEKFQEIQRILRNNSLQVLLAGKSYRPASNGIQYQWYIRVSDESGKHPTLERLSRILVTRESVEDDIATEGLDPDSLLEKIAAQGKEIKRLQTALDDEAQQYQAAVQRCKTLQRQNEQLKLIYDESQSELQNYRQRIQHLEKIREIAFKPEDVAKIRQDYEDIVQKLRQALEKKEKELRTWIHAFDPEIEKLRQEKTVLERHIRDLENQIAMKEEERKQLIDQIHETRIAREIDPEKENPEDLFRETLSVLLSDIEFLGGSLETLWREMQDPISVLKALSNLGKLRASRVRRADQWLERHIDQEWRLYFRKCESSNYQVLIAHKNTQEADIDWLKHQ